MTYFNPILTFENHSFREFVLCATLLALKILALMMATIMVRAFKGVYMTAEDAEVWPPIVQKFIGRKRPESKKFTAVTDPMVERIRNAHAHDIENLVLFFGIGFLYTLCGLTNPRILFYTFTLSRYAHTWCYVIFEAQPWRLICHLCASAILLYMTFGLLVNALFA